MKSFTVVEANKKLQFLSEAIKLNPTSVDALMERAYTLKSMPIDRKFLITDLETIVKLNANHLPARLMLSEALIGVGKAAAAVQHLQLIRQEDPTNEKAHDLIQLINFQYEQNLQKVLEEVDKFCDAIGSETTRATDKATYMLLFGEFEKVDAFCNEQVTKFENLLLNSRLEKQEEAEELREIIKSIEMVRQFATSVKQGFAQFPQLEALFKQPNKSAALMTKENLRDIYCEKTATTTSGVKDVESWSKFSDCIALLSFMISAAPQQAVVFSSVFKNLVLAPGRELVQTVTTNAYANFLLFANTINKRNQCHMFQPKFTLFLEKLKKQAIEDNSDFIEMSFKYLEDPNLESFYEELSE